MNAKDYAARLLSVCDRSEKEIREKILKKGYSSDECEDAVAFCREYGYIDDERYAEHFVHDAVNLKKLGRERIKLQLRQKGIQSDVIENALRCISGEQDIIKDELDRRFKDVDLSDKKAKNKVFGYFARRGFKASDILSAMNEECDYDTYDE